MTPPPSPRQPSAVTIARYGPTDGRKGINEEAIPKPPSPKLPAIERTTRQEERFEMFQRRIEEQARPGTTEAKRKSRLSRQGTNILDSVDGSFMINSGSEEENPVPLVKVLDGTVMEENQDQPNFRLAAGVVLREALKTTIGDAIDGRSLGPDSTWVD